MDVSTQLAGSARRNEDIALDLMKFIATTTGAGRTATGSTGFVAAGSAKPDDNVAPLLELYTRCLHAVEGK
jgi:hypothetical protein